MVWQDGYSRHSSLTTDCPATVNVRRDTASRHQGFCAAVCRVGDVCPCNGSCGKLRVHKTWFLRNEPTVFRLVFVCIRWPDKGLELWRAQFFGGFVLENEPTGTPQLGLFLGGSVAAATTSRHLVRLVLENEPTGTPQERAF